MTQLHFKFPIAVLAFLIAVQVLLGQTRVSAGAPVVQPGNLAVAKPAKPFTHDGEMTRLAFAPDGKTLASAGNDGTVRLWEVATGKELYRWTGHKGRVLALGFHPQGKFVAAGGEDDFIYLWDPVSGKQLRQIKAGGARDLQFSPEKEYGFFASCSDVIYVRQGTQGLLWHSFQKETLAAITTVAFVGPDGSYLVSGADDGTIRLWGLIPGWTGDLRPFLVRRFGGHPGSVNHVAASPNGKHVASAGPHGLVLWEISEEASLHLWKKDVVSNVLFSKDGKSLIAPVANGVYFYNIETKKETKSLDGRGGGPLGGPLALSADGNTLAIGERPTIRFWDLEKDQEIVRGKGK